ncbi:hypothetical protein DYBT9275_00929 [Dyadobacter sp. CECT 9275]|uniref:Uncharacterized protein n=1 Tax=Dyadobacter helix TaxID=2822344 RepID=A0A916J975_9BACT|nr:O-methyltransferase [Dyadobacter sp. CECT 9275]CAG4992276.1 hypothetical protein DYBT9275_00929 [Dyadobacter sp. CECT 9275]
MSGGYVWYHLRPNKAVERQLFIELLAKLNRYLPISDYCYISFGGPYFEDFKLIHTHFANTKMISIEEDPNVFERQKFNLPHACIRTENCTSGQFITDRLDSNESNIIWLDYASASDQLRQFTEFQSLLSKSRLYDVIKITLNANPSSLFDGSQRKIDGSNYTSAELYSNRLEKLNERIGSFLPNNLVANQMTKDQYPAVLNRALDIAASQIITTVDNNLRFQPLTSFYYGDSEHQMLTVTGIVINHTEITEFLKATGIDKWDLASTVWGTTKLIQVPALTAKEKYTLDQKIPNQDIGELQAVLGFYFDQKKKIHDQILDSYQKYYRYYPSYHKVVS